MNGVGLDISGNGYKFNFSKISGNDCTTQNVIVVLGTDIGTDSVFLNKGTELSIFFIGKNYISVTNSQHLSNFAALDAFNFYKQFNNDKTYITAVEIDASSLFLNSPKLQVDVIIATDPSLYRQ